MELFAGLIWFIIFGIIVPYVVGWDLLQPINGMSWLILINTVLCWVVVVIGLWRLCTDRSAAEPSVRTDRSAAEPSVRPRRQPRTITYPVALATTSKGARET